ncbi:response regulator [Neobacillus sp. NPDC058068]|uniref:response regulator transcription factor n=1 Tax=Neobacillus sp. NPDC058068 TaxID=3346325 RepID=UPI0036DC54AD
MYKVMLVDDDYPVIELLAKTITWEDLGLTLQSTHENGASAYEKALDEVPDILITDIGMPKMNGIELTKRVKELNPNLQVVILSCHSEFEFAQQALKLHVQDYVVKDTFDPEDLCNLVRKLKENLDSQQNEIVKQRRIQHMLERNRESVKERFIRNTLYQKHTNEKEWLSEAKLLGIDLDHYGYVAVLGMVHDFSSLKSYFLSEELVGFAINNIITEMIEESRSSAVHFFLGAKELIVFFPYSDALKIGSMYEASVGMKKMQKALNKYLHIDLSFMVGEGCKQLLDIKQEVSHLVNGKYQSFYMEPGSIQKSSVVQPFSDDLFSKYDEAAADFRGLILSKDEREITPFVEKWVSFIGEKRYSPEIVKEWILKLLLDLKVKLKALQFFHANHPVECLTNEISSIDFLCDLKTWLINYFNSLVSLSKNVYNQTKRKEILDTFRYVSMNLEKKISLEEVAGNLFLNQSYFSRLFKKEVGETFVEYVTKMKISRAKELLEQTADPVGKICERLGYDNQSYFIKLFKNYVGVTPIEYRDGKVSVG